MINGDNPCSNIPKFPPQLGRGWGKTPHNPAAFATLVKSQKSFPQGPCFIPRLLWKTFSLSLQISPHPGGGKSPAPPGMAGRERSCVVFHTVHTPYYDNELNILIHTSGYFTTKPSPGQSKGPIRPPRFCRGDARPERHVQTIALPNAAPGGNLGGLSPIMCGMPGESGRD